MIRYWVILTVVQTFFLQDCFCQNKPKFPFFEVIHEDSVQIFLNWKLRPTEKQCAVYTRFTRADNNGNFRGRFLDVSHTNDLLGSGQYIDGKKNGNFELYYTNGKIMGWGKYVNDVPVGIWDFFYENGLLERTIEFKGDEVLMLTAVDRKGRLQVDKGNGVFKGPVAQNEGLMARGKIVNGRPDGKWISWLPHQGRFSYESYKDGKYISGRYSRSFRFYYINHRPYGGLRDSIGRKAYRKARKLMKTYEQRLNVYFFDNYLSEVEQLQFQPCDTVHLDEQSHNLRIQAFRAELNNRLNEAMMNNNKYLSHGYEEGAVIYHTLRFSVDHEGRPENFEGVNHLGSQFDSSVASLISGLIGFIPEKEMYFRLKLYFISPSKYRFSYRFTSDKLMTW